MRRTRRTIALSAAVAAAAAVGLGAVPAHAATFDVTNLNDSGPGSFRQAVLDANATAGPDEVTFAPGLAGVISLTSGWISPTDSITISGPGASLLTLEGDGATSVISVTSGVQVVISGLTISGGGGAAANSGGVYVNHTGADVTIRHATLSNNDGYYGGGASVYNGQLRVEDSRITGNRAWHGGGIATATSTTLTRVEISGNTVTGSGGALFLNSGSMLVHNSTISGNTALTGGGIHRFTSGAALTLNHSTIVGNQSFDGSASGINGLGTTTLNGSIVSGNANRDVSDRINAAWSLIADTTGATVTDLVGSLFDVDPQLEALADNGGPTRTHLPRSSSPVIDAGDPSITDPSLIDQRGRQRVARSTASGPERIDIGAVELVYVEPPRPELAATGVDALGMVALAAGGITVGAVLLQTTRRRYS